MSLLPTCRDVSRVLSERRDDGRGLGWHVRIHLAVCDVCRQVLRQFSLLGALARDASGGPSLSPDAKERLKKALGSR